jgi:eukaryotic-like serine/threonine-protein kinase
LSGRRSRTSSTRPKPAWRSDALIGLAVLLLVFVLQATTDLFGGVERRFYDLASVQTDRRPDDRIAVIAIDDQSVANIGRWPWPRDVHARLIDLLSQAQAKTVVHTAFFFEPQTERGVGKLRELQSLLSAASPAEGLGGLDESSRQRLLNFIGEAERSLDADGQLVTSLQRAGQVIVPSVFALGESPGRPDRPLPGFALRSALPDPGGVGLPARASQQPIAAIGEAARAVGHLNQFPDQDGAIRQEVLLVNFNGQAVPSVALLAAAHSLNLGAEDMRIVPGEGLELGRLKIPFSSSSLVLPQFYADRGGRAAFPVDSFYDVVSGKIPASKYTDKIVIVGATAAGVGSLFATPASTAMSPAGIVANTTSSILNGHFITQPAWASWVGLLVLLLVGAYLLVALPRLKAGTAAGVTAGLFVLLLGTEYGLLAHSAIWVQLVFPVAALLIGHLALTTRRFLVTEAGKLRSDEESAETNRMMGLALQGQGQLDMAFDRFRRVPGSAALMDNLKHLALDFERKRQFNKAQAVYEHMARFDRDNADVQTQLMRAKNLSETVMLGSKASHPGGTLLLSQGGGVEKPMLGRYQVEKELGKGAMGVVYQGRDPKIGRIVAIKTLALSAEFEGVELQDARERFFREAETAGRLQHPNIVTIYDAGEEHDLAYIAMEFLGGHDLMAHARPGQLLPVRTVLTIVERVALALDYAHQHNVVHRDIKPANIMYDAATDAVKVTDFGIARITDASRTKTGMVLGTPSFMSPEHLAGQKVTGSSDLYSLGITLFQLLTGVLPLRGDSMAALMYRIANQPAPDVRDFRAELPSALADILHRMLAKAPQDRYPSGKLLAEDLRHVVIEARQPGPDLSGMPVFPTRVGDSESTLAQTVRVSDNAFVATLVSTAPAPSGHPAP